MKLWVALGDREWLCEVVDTHEDNSYTVQHPVLPEPLRVPQTIVSEQ